MSVAADSDLRPAAELRAQRFAPHEAGDNRTQDAELHRTALHEAGFAEVAEVWRHRSDAVRMAIR